MADIQKGRRLRKVTQVNDRSAPAVESKRNILTVVPTYNTANYAMALNQLFSTSWPVGVSPSGDRQIENY